MKNYTVLIVRTRFATNGSDVPSNPKLPAQRVDISQTYLTIRQQPYGPLSYSARWQLIIEELEPLSDRNPHDQVYLDVLMEARLKHFLSLIREIQQGIIKENVLTGGWA